jgi:predicted GH43/DUF377 family glycosyl hydrolase
VLQTTNPVDGKKLHTIVIGTGSTADANANANITPLTEMVTARVLGSEPNVFFATFDSAVATQKITMANIATAQNEIGLIFTGTVDITTIGNFITRPLIAATQGSPTSGDAQDKLLDALKLKLTSAQLGIVTTALAGNKTTDAIKQTVISLATVPTTPPVANAGSAQSVMTGATVTLDASASSASTGKTLTYAWLLTSKPAGSAATLAASTSPKPTFLADTAGVYVASAIVNDGTTTSSATAVTVTASAVNLDGGLSMDANFRPFVKQGKITGFTHDIWDDKVYGPVILLDQDGVTYRMYYTGYNSTGKEWYPFMATSKDLKNWTKKNLGVVSIGGSTNNNALFTRPNKSTYMADVIYAEGVYRMLINDDHAAKGHVYISTDGGQTFTYEREVTSMATHFNNQYLEAKSLLFVDGVYRVYYSEGHRSQLRSLGYYEWYPGKAPVDQGLISGFISSNRNLQYYDIHVWEHDGAVWGVVNPYNKTTEVLGPLDLYSSSDGGVTWEQKGPLVQLGETGEFDAQLISNAKPIQINNTWYVMYTASPSGHNYWPREMAFGLATGTLPSNVRKR